MIDVQVNRFNVPHPVDLYFVVDQVNSCLDIFFQTWVFLHLTFLTVIQDHSKLKNPKYPSDLPHRTDRRVFIPTASFVFLVAFLLS